jgi:hypothetical protein
MKKTLTLPWRSAGGDAGGNKDDVEGGGTLGYKGGSLSIPENAAAMKANMSWPNELTHDQVGLLVVLAHAVWQDSTSCVDFFFSLSLFFFGDTSSVVAVSCGVRTHAVVLWCVG